MRGIGLASPRCLSAVIFRWPHALLPFTSSSPLLFSAAGVELAFFRSWQGVLAGTSASPPLSGREPPWPAHCPGVRRTLLVGLLAGRRSARLRLAAWRLVVGGAPGFAVPALSRARSGSSLGSGSFWSWSCGGSCGPCALVPWSRLPAC